VKASLAELPGVARAKLPASYEGAREALDKCQRIDECQTWADKAEALASYAKQAEDDGLRKMADRIQARAVRRCGELLRAIEAAANQHRARGGGPPSRAQAARDAGLSRDQKRNAMRVAAVPREEFEAAVESDDPPTVTQLAEQGTKRVLVDLGGRDPADFQVATHALGALRQLAEFAQRTDPAAVRRGSFDRERKAMAANVDVILDWLARLTMEIGR
jgi:hypothetical protein